ncbi:TRAP-type C4-dicarboxylate transport system permease small subunit [Planifilum fimeticola]|uniref:TRAP-type C4-dicarboxylate transport system permease small subunit n=1 Tax=Planifilum fimeticola TaxID=201975 RepID=A0A2T0LDE6_9BACL|nr:TRAP transporter small permease [Planifilum fimeticola]PRX40053.1 TRAP-type C4-dicarboxylate transport system permease small subunit [Planifilum fimeticola]
MWNKAIRGINRTVENLTALFLAAMVVLIFLQILMRLVMAKSFSWTEEAARYLMIWLTFLAASYGFRRGAHVGVSVIVERLPMRFQRWVQAVAGLVCLVFFALLVIFGFELMDRSMMQHSPALNFPMGYVYSVIPISGILMALNLIDVLIRTIRTGRGGERS